MALRINNRLHFHPLIFAGALIAKKAIVWRVVKIYGLPRVYRRILELEVRLNKINKYYYNFIRSA